MNAVFFYASLWTRRKLMRISFFFSYVFSFVYIYFLLFFCLLQNLVAWNNNGLVILLNVFESRHFLLLLQTSLPCGFFPSSYSQHTKHISYKRTNTVKEVHHNKHHNFIFTWNILNYMHQKNSKEEKKQPYYQRISNAVVLHKHTQMHCRFVTIWWRNRITNHFRSVHSMI